MYEDKNMNEAFSDILLNMMKDWIKFLSGGMIRMK